MKQTPVKAVEMVRAIRDAMYEETKNFSREELKEFFARESAAFRQESQKPEPGSHEAGAKPARRG
jgi:hypothetical protein